MLCCVTPQIAFAAEATTSLNVRVGSKHFEKLIRESG